MPAINDILNWSFIPSNLSRSAERIITSETKKHLKQSIRKINEISNRSLAGGSSPEPMLLKDVYVLFKKNKNRGHAELVTLFSKRDARLLVWALDYHVEEDELPIVFTDDIKPALKVISDRWRDSFIISFWHTLLKNWDAFLVQEKERKIYLEFLVQKCKEYEGSRRDILSFLSNQTLLLDRDSPSDYAKQLIAKNIDINKANELINQKANILLYEYFSNVVLNYVNYLNHNNIEDETLNKIYEFLEYQNKFKTKLLVCSAVINSTKFSLYKNDIKKHTINLIGDPIRRDLWVHKDLTERQEELVESARMKLNALLNQAFIKVFFEKLVQDSRRKKYWLKFIDKIQDIKFVGNKSNYHYLKNIESISRFVDSRYKITSGNQNTCALVIYSQNFVFVEFTDTGALYIYKENNFNVNLNAVSSMPDLKIWPRSLWACKNSAESGYVDLREEGRITHQGEWESRFDAWMNRYYKVLPVYKKKRPLASTSNKNESTSSSDKSIYVDETSSEENLGESYGDLFNSTIRGKNYVPQEEDEQWESKTLYWSKKELPGYRYSYNKDAWWKKKSDY
ncbi:EH signature domain-containing protein [Algibacter mikhailovii]|uniref:EH signature domain-containing protein n=1 Tax=Algibacter mikhailovii TaxID=425498 RepID=UPI00249481F9|nr:EH signature domain-containing protein [Algibacter mikhailovii]